MVQDPEVMARLQAHMQLDIGSSRTTSGALAFTAACEGCAASGNGKQGAAVEDLEVVTEEGDLEEVDTEVVGEEEEVIDQVVEPVEVEIMQEVLGECIPLEAARIARTRIRSLLYILHPK